MCWILSNVIRGYRMPRKRVPSSGNQPTAAQRAAAHTAATQAAVAAQAAAAANQNNAPNPVPAGNQVNNNNVPVNNQAQVVELFRSYSPPTFTGKEEPSYVEEWIRSLERTFKHIACTDAQRVICAEYQLAEGADRWWERY